MIDDESAEPANESSEATADEATDTDPMATLAAENAELKDKLLRAAAEMENLRKRSAREVAESRLYSIAGFARDMLTATDNLARALEALPEKERHHAEGTLKALIEGVELTEREMQRLLEKHGVARIEAMGERFDPHMHQAMFEVTETEEPDNTVVQVVQEGYAIGERVLRPAMVGVAKSGRKAPTAETASADSAPDAAPEDGVDKSV